MSDFRKYKGLDHRILDRRQRDREAMLIAQDRADERVEQMRQDAEEAALEGKVANLQDTVVAPTPEWMSKGETVPYTPRGRDGTVKSVKTVKRRMFDVILNLEARGFLDERQAGACRWFRDLHEGAQIERSAGVASYGETIRGDMLYGHLPASELAARIRSDYREAQRVLPVGATPVFERVVIGNLSIDRAARSIRRRKEHVSNMLRHGADRLADLAKARGEANENAR